MTSGKCLGCNDSSIKYDQHINGLTEADCIKKCKENTNCTAVGYSPHSMPGMESCYVFLTSNVSRGNGPNAGGTKCFAVPNNCQGKLQFH